MEILEKITNIKSKYKTLKNEAWSKYLDISEEEKKEIMSLFDMEYEFLCIDNKIYLCVNEQFEHRSINDNEPIIVLRGQGFKYLVTPYTDATFMNWDQFYSYEFKIKDIESELKKIKKITKEEYDSAFEKMMEEIKKEHYKYYSCIK